MIDSKKPVRKWHLVEDEEDSVIVDFELALMRLTRAFNRFNENCVNSILGQSLSAGEVNLLHVIRMHDTAKTAAILATLLNRDDFSNIQYGLKKLRQAKLIRVNPKSSAKQYSYEITAKGTELTDKFVEIRKDKVIIPIKSIHEWESRLEDAERIIRLLTGIFEVAARETVVYWNENDK